MYFYLTGAFWLNVVLWVCFQCFCAYAIEDLGGGKLLVHHGQPVPRLQARSNGAVIFGCFLRKPYLIKLFTRRDRRTYYLTLF